MIKLNLKKLIVKRDGLVIDHLKPRKYRAIYALIFLAVPSLLFLINKELNTII